MLRGPEQGIADKFLFAPPVMSCKSGVGFSDDSRCFVGCLLHVGVGTIKLSFEFLNECLGLRAIDKDGLDSSTEEVCFDVI